MWFLELTFLVFKMRSSAQNRGIPDRIGNTVMVVEMRTKIDGEIDQSWRWTAITSVYSTNS